MNDLFGILITFGPLILIILLANLAERARERASLAQVAPTLVNREARPDSLPEMASMANVAALSGDPNLLPASLTQFEPDPQPLDPSIAQPAMPVATPPASDGTVWAFLAYALISMYFFAALMGSVVALIMPLQIANPTPEFSAYLVEFPYLADFDWTLIAVGSALIAIIGSFSMLRPVRRLLSRFIPIDPLSTVHSVSLGILALVVLQVVLTVGVGIGTMADMMALEDGTTSGAMTITSAWLQAGLFVLMGFIGVGWLVRRNTHAARIRLAIVMPTIPQVLVAIGLGFAMVGVVLALEVVSNSLGWGFDEDVGRLSEQLLGGLILTVPGVLTLGLSAGIGEETLMRGAVQPRLGLVLTSVIFALLHGNYGLTLSTLAVLIVGFSLGILRNRTNTTAAMIMHATYNCILGFLPFLWQQ